MADEISADTSSERAPVLRAIGLVLIAACAVLTLATALDVGAATSGRVSGPLVHDRLGGGVVDHSIRIRQGLPLYSEPDDHFVPLVYTPLYYYLAAGSMSFLGEGAAACRVTSLALVLASLLVALALIRHVTGGWVWGAAALPFAAAGYPVCHFFYDSPRPDPASTLAVLLAAWVALRFRSVAAGVVLGALLCVAYFCKQSSLVFSVLFLAAVALEHPRRGIVAGAVFAGLTGALVAWANLATDGWFWTYCIYLPTQHEYSTARTLQILRADWGVQLVLPAAALLVAAVALMRRWRGTEADRNLRLVLLAALAMAAFCFASHARPGATAKVLMPFCLFAAAALPIAFSWLDAGVRSARGRWAVRSASALIVGAFLVQHRFDPMSALATEEDLVRWSELQESFARHAEEGQVWVAPWGYLTTPVDGQEMRPNLIALEDYLGVKGNVTGQAIPPALQAAIENHEFSAIFFPTKRGGFRPLRELVKKHYKLEERFTDMTVGVQRFSMSLGVFTPRESSGAAGPRRRRGQR